MRFPNTRHSKLIIFWLIVSIFIALLGITVINLSDISPRTHPIIDQVQKIIISERPALDTFLSIIGSAFVGYVVFSVWAMLSFAIFCLLRFFDADLKDNIRFMFYPGEISDSNLSSQELSDLSLKIIILTFISSAISFILLSLLYSWQSS